MTHAKQCPWPHSINRLVGVKATCLEELPKSCTCGELLTYADDLIFISEPKVSGLNPDVVEVTPLGPFQHRAGTPMCCYGSPGCTKGNAIGHGHDCGRLRPEETPK